MPITKRKKNNKNKTKKIKFNEKVMVLTDTIKPFEEIIFDTKDKSVSDNINLQIESFFKIPYSSKLKEIGNNDFYGYVNDIWDKDNNNSNDITNISDEMRYLVKLDNFRVVQFKIYNQLDKIINDYVTKHKTIVSSELENFYSSVLKLNSISSSRNYLKNIVQQIDLLRKDKKNLWKMLALINKNEFLNIFAPFSWHFLPDKKNSTNYVNYIEPHQFSIFDPAIYEDPQYSENERKQYIIKYKKFFISYLKKLFGTTLPHDKSLNPNDVFEIGRKFYAIFGMYDKKIVESDDFYNKVTKEEAIKKYKFNWTEYCKELGYEEKNIPDFFIVSNLQYFKFCTEELLENWNSKEWRSYWIWIFARFYARFTRGWDYIYFEFYGKITQGLSESFTKKRNIMHAAVDACAFVFNPLLNNEYIDIAYNEDNIVFTKQMANNLKNMFINKIKRNTWLEPRTKQYAIFKIENIDIEVGSKKFDANYNDILPLLNYNPNEFIENYLKVIEWRHNLYITGNIDIIKSLVYFDYNSYPYKITGLPSYMVNAQYILNENKIKISTAYLQKPFINIIDQGIEYNLAQIGFTIAHELCHALDVNGSKYDVNGNLKDWWGKNDKIRFKKIQQDIIRNFITFSKYDNIEYDPTASLGEAIADISGFNLCEEYLRNYCLQNHYTPIMIYLYFRLFYVYFSVQMKQKIGKQSIKYELITNPHPIDKYRTNVTLSRSKLFKSLHNIKKGDKMYWRDSKIWE